MMFVYNPMDAKEKRTTVRNAGFYAEFDESNSETSESEYNIKKRKRLAVAPREREI